MIKIQEFEEVNQDNLNHDRLTKIAHGKILEAVKGFDVDDALSILDSCKHLILTYSEVSYPWNR